MKKVIHEISENLRALSCKDVPVFVALDGRCAAGKTTLAEKLQQMMNCTVFHMDDFFLRPEQRSKERVDTPGGNVDYERFLEEILIPLKSGVRQISYQPYDCHEKRFLQPVVAELAQIVLIEGSYSCHPKLWDFYGLHIFLTVDPDEQLRRIARRNGKNSIRQFQERWIPLEEQYFMAYQVMERCDLCFET